VDSVFLDLTLNTIVIFGFAGSFTNTKTRNQSIKYIFIPTIPINRKFNTYFFSIANLTSSFFPL
jgi:hypothetical protein